MPVKSSIRYWFEFSTPNVDGGEPDVAVRADEAQPTTPGFGGGIVNRFDAVNDCSEVDAGTGTRSP